MADPTPSGDGFPHGDQEVVGITPERPVTAWPHYTAAVAAALALVIGALVVIPQADLGGRSDQDAVASIGAVPVGEDVTAPPAELEDEPEDEDATAEEDPGLAEEPTVDESADQPSSDNTSTNEPKTPSADDPPAPAGDAAGDESGYGDDPATEPSGETQPGNAPAATQPTTTKPTATKPTTTEPTTTEPTTTKPATATVLDRVPSSVLSRPASYVLVNRSSGGCVGVKGAAAASGADVVQRNCTVTSSRWRLYPTSEGYFRLMNRSNGHALDLPSCKAANGTNLQTWPWLNNDCQQWKILRTEDGWMRLVNRSSNKVLDLAACGKKVGTVIQQYNWLNNGCQQWRLAPVGKIAVMSNKSGKVLGVSGCKADSTAANVEASGWAYKACQRWSFVYASDGYYRIKPASAAKTCLVVARALKSNGANVAQGPCTGSNAQWRIVPQAKGGVRLVARHSGKSLNLDGCKLANGTNIEQQSWKDTACQRFQLRSSMPTPPTKAVSYRLVNRASGGCVGVGGDPKRGGADLSQQKCTAGASYWVVHPTSDGYYRLMNRANGRAMDLAGCQKADGATVQTYRWLNNDCQQWKILSTADGWVRLMNRSSGKALDLAGCGKKIGVKVQQWRWLNNRCQQFRLSPAGEVAVVSAKSGKVLDVAECKPVAGTNVRVWTWLASKCHKWTFTHVNSGYYRIRSAAANAQCLVVAGSSTSAGGNVALGACSGGNSQWRIETQANGGVRLVVRHSGLSLDLAGCGIADGTNIAQWTNNGTDCQRFYLRRV